VRRRGFTILEVVLALAVIAVAFLVLFSIFGSGARHAVQTRNRTMGMLVAQSIMEDLRGHQYGQPAPASWPIGPTPKTESFAFYVDGKPQEMVFRKQVTLDNGSLVGAAAGDADRATIVVSWDELTVGTPAERARLADQHKVTASILLRRSSYGP